MLGFDREVVGRPATPARKHSTSDNASMIRIHSILLADEPTGNLDSKRSQSVTDLLREPHSGRRTICLVTHQERFARDAQHTSIFSTERSRKRDR